MNGGREGLSSPSETADSQAKRARDEAFFPVDEPFAQTATIAIWRP